MISTNSDLTMSNEARRLRQFLVWDMPANILALIVLPTLILVFPGLDWAWIIVVEVVVNQILLMWAYVQVKRGNTEQVVVALCFSLWLILITATFLIPAVFPMMPLLTVWPVTLALSYLSFKSLRWLMYISTSVAIICSLLSVRDDPFRIAANVPHWVILFLNSFFIPIFTILIFIILWHYSRRQTETLTQTKQANAALLESERLLEARVQERTTELVQKNAALEQYQLELALARDEALEANRAKSNFLAAMSHELRTPLNAIIGYSEMLEEEAHEEGQAEIVEDLSKIHGAGKHLLSLINDILDLSKIEAGKMELYLEVFDLNEMLQDVITTVQPLITRQHNRLEVVVGPGLGSVYSDVTKVRQSLFNLLSNAAKFTENGVITLRVERQNKQIMLVVQDNGIGMSPEQQTRLFQAFTQADASTTRKYGGTGLGLAITQRFCQMMGGNIRVESAVGQGSTFTIMLPTAVTEPTEETNPTIAEIPTTTSSQPLDNTNLVLVIDDDPHMRELIQRFLVKDGFRVEAAYKGDDGLRLARELQPAAIILDVMMPGMDGWAVLNTLKADPKLADIPVVMATMVDDKNLGYALGASDYLTKPIDRNRLSSIVRKYRHDIPQGIALVVEDDENARQMMCSSLEKEGWTVQQAENGRVALESIAQQTPDLILLDLMMPEVDGFEVIAELHKHPRWRTIPVVVVTAKELSVEDRRRLNGSVERILQKGSYSREDLVQTLRKLVRHNQPAETTVRLT